MKSGDNVHEAALRCLRCAQPAEKCKRTEAVFRDIGSGRLQPGSAHAPVAIEVPGRPPRPTLVEPREVPHRGPGTVEGRAGLLHALAHIEFNAINLAWDAVYRFREMPVAFYTDWARVAREEAFHFQLLCGCLEELGYAYGDFNAHNGLWEMACKTAHDPLVRMALVPRVLEARGLDVTPGILERLRNSGDARAVEALEIILHDEVGHVQIGSRWFRYLCQRRGLAPEATFASLVNEYMRGQVKQPFHYEARRQAGFNEREMQYLEQMASSRGR